MWGYKWNFQTFTYFDKNQTNNGFNVKILYLSIEKLNNF